MSYSFDDLVQWSLNNPTAGQQWAGRRRIKEEFSECTYTEARKAAEEAKAWTKNDEEVVGEEKKEKEEEECREPSHKDEMSDEEIKAWGISHPSDTKLIASRRMLIDEFDLTKRRASRLTKEMREEARSILTSSEGESREGATVNLNGNKLETTLVTQTSEDEDLTLDQTLENPKLKNAVKSSSIDLDDFYVQSFKARSWDVTMRHEGKKTNHYIAVKWQRKDPSPDVTAIKNIISKMPREAKIFDDTNLSEHEGKYMCEIGLYDVHFGMLSWAAETGENYDVKIASKIIEEVTRQIIARTKHRNIDYYFLPIGNDFLHIDDSSARTPRSGNKLDMDTRLGKIIEEAESAIFNLVDNLREVAPVELTWIPGNHDPETSYHMLRTLAVRHEHDNKVTVDTGLKPRKVKAYGPNLIGLLHGCDIAKSRLKELPAQIMEQALEEGCLKPDMYKEIHMGHTHAASKSSFKGLSNHGPCELRVLPSIAGTDYWHFKNGYDPSSKTAQFFMWPDNAPLESIQHVRVPTEMYK